MKAKIVEKVTRHIVCPGCSNEDGFRFDMGISTCFGPWYCKQCGQGITGVVNEDRTIEIDLGSTVKKTKVLLKIPPLLQDVYMVINGTKVVGEGNSDLTYFYDEHNCPINDLRSVGVVIYNGSSDPHGLFKFVGELEEWPEEIETGMDGDCVVRLFKAVRRLTGGENDNTRGARQAIVGGSAGRRRAGKANSTRRKSAP